MEKFDILEAVAAPLPMANVDTDKIIPARFLKTIRRSGLGAHLFEDLRYQVDGKENPDFILNKPQYRNAKILIAGRNFGCGSSREHAPWALLDFGIKCLIAPSFADIFFNNCFKNGILPVTLTEIECKALMTDAESGSNARIIVDLKAQAISRPDGTVYTFEIDTFRKRCLLGGLDDIGLTLEHGVAITEYEAKSYADPWRPRIELI